jgi:hypothetical protein
MSTDFCVKTQKIHKKATVIIAHFNFILYNADVAYQYPQQGGGVYPELPHFLYNCCHGWCSMSLHHQMVRQ